MRSRWLVGGLTAVVAVAALALTGCSNDPLAQQYRAGSGKNYIAGDGSVTEIAEANRTEAITFAATDLDGKPVGSQQFSGKVVVVNFWYAGCAPCRAEAEDLESVYQKVADQGVVFLGVNVRDSNETARAFNETFGITYPSVSDLSGKVQLAFASNVPPNAVPTTLVLDTQGRVAARILGRISDASILTTLVTDQVKAK
jgi:peroxiredoxin